MFSSTFRQLEVLVAVVENGSFVAAAQLLGISHPSVSNHIRRLEKELGCDLFMRRPGAPAALSEQGRRVYDRAKRLTEEVCLLVSDVAPALTSAVRPRLTLSTQRVLAEFVLCRPIADFVLSRPEVDLVVDVGTFEQTIASVPARTADLCCVMTYGAIPGMESDIIGRARFGFFVAPGHPLAAARQVGAAELAGQTFVATRRDGHYGQMVHKLIGSIGVRRYSIAYQIQEGAVLNEIAARGCGVACGFVAGAEALLREGRLVELSVEGEPLFTDLHLLWPAGRQTGSPAAQFAAILRENLAATAYADVAPVRPCATA